jgi:hypothetical protein
MLLLVMVYIISYIKHNIKSRAVYEHVMISLKLCSFCFGFVQWNILWIMLWEQLVPNYSCLLQDMISITFYK